MSRSVQTGNAVAKVIGYILLVLVVVGVIGVIVYFTGGFTSDFKTFYVSVDGKTSSRARAAMKSPTKNLSPST